MATIRIGVKLPLSPRGQYPRRPARLIAFGDHAPARSLAASRRLGSGGAHPVSPRAQLVYVRAAIPHSLALAPYPTPSGAAGRRSQLRRSCRSAAVVAPLASRRVIAPPRRSSFAASPYRAALRAALRARLLLLLYGRIRSAWRLGPTALVRCFARAAPLAPSAPLRGGASSHAPPCGRARFARSSTGGIQFLNFTQLQLSTTH